MHYYNFTALIYRQDNSKDTLNLSYKSLHPSHIPDFRKYVEDELTNEGEMFEAIVISKWEEVLEEEYVEKTLNRDLKHR